LRRNRIEWLVTCGRFGVAMTLEINFPVEFFVAGTPVSVQGKRAESRTAWKVLVREASYAALPEGHFSTIGPVSVTLFYFPEAEMRGDIDNIVKPILDALSNHIYSDDKQVERVWVQKFEPGRIFQFSNPTRILAQAIEGEKPLLFVRLTDDPTEGLA
jgi:crossover junction endodeoxyribonuclease RusA